MGGGGGGSSSSSSGGGGSGGGGSVKVEYKGVIDVKNLTLHLKGSRTLLNAVKV